MDNNQIAHTDGTVIAGALVLLAVLSYGYQHGEQGIGALTSISAVFTITLPFGISAMMAGIGMNRLARGFMVAGFGLVIIVVGLLLAAYFDNAVKYG